MFILNEQTNRYEAILKAGTLVSISQKRFEDDAYNRAVMSASDAPFTERLAQAKAIILEHPDIYRAKHNGFSVIIMPVKALRSR